MCAERAAVAHNMLKFLGWGSTYYTGKLSTDETDADLHAFVIYKKPNGEQNIYDSMNPEIIENPEGKVVSVKPSIYPGGNEILSGNPVVVRHPKYELKDGEYTETSSQVYRYFNNPLIAMRA